MIQEAEMGCLLVAAAIAIVEPAMPPARQALYARVIDAEARHAHVDPLLVVAIVEHESRWRKAARSRDGQDYGLGQIRANLLPECRIASSRRCRATKHRLLTDAIYNLRRAIRILGAWRATCKTPEATVTGYAAGRCSPPPKAAQEILALRADLHRKLARRFPP
jgi:soluble lytic murein transglycosylase-like protein